MAELIKPGYDDTADIADINSNTDEFAARIANCKTKQTAKTDPSADGTAVSFIDSVTQNANGEVTATKKTVKNMTGATASAAGAAGLAPAPSAGDQSKFLQGNGTWGTPANTTYSQATSSALGLVKIGFTASGKNYPVQLNGSGQMYVNVPWTDNNTTYGEASSSTYGLIKIGYTANGKNYPVQLSGGKAYVNVPWTDNNTTYSNFGGATSSKAGSAGLVPAPGAGKQFSVLYGEGGWATLQDLLNTTQAIAPNKMNGTPYRIQFKWGHVQNVPAINGQASKTFDNPFETACFCVFTQVASTHNGVYARIRTYNWDNYGFGYQAQTGDSSNISFYYLAIGV